MPEFSPKTVAEVEAEPPRKPRPERGPSPPTARPPASPKALPEYTQSLLHVRVPVVVMLARKRQTLGRIVELGPGSIIQFEKSCEEMLELEAGGQPIALGEAVKVGDKFGLRITSIILPDERFKPVEPEKRKSSGRAPAGAWARSSG
jgi:flagellar motor switch/type III secretory pathway protein FliN